ncbi:putative bifunctional diguanylate cyclase/phosphodiesterase [Aestuariibius insulae]|uniref:putative bifunctional diguanylate cyclase/phosphodiesterase n=1 Tax=Aestuariibius insulae TaxID=2058287 RepID=UPI00345E1C00
MNRSLSLFVSLWFIFALIALFAIASTAIVFQIKKSFEQSLVSETVTQGPRVKDAAYALTGIHNLERELFYGASLGNVYPDWRSSLENRLGALYFQADNFASSMDEGPEPEAARRMYLAVTDSIEIAQRSLIADDTEVPQLLTEFRAQSEDSRIAIVRYIDLIRNAQETEIERQSAVIGIVSNWLAFAIIGVNLVVACLLFLLRVEVKARRRREEAEHQAEFLTRNDVLTNLPNRVALHEVLAQIAASDRTCLLLLIDVERFSAINEAYGHAGGDIVLQTVGSRLEDWALARNGIAARLGGDEFGVLIPQDTDICDADIQTDFIDSLDRAVDVPGTSLHIVLSVGAAQSSQIQKDADNWSEALARAAELALAEAKYRSKQELVCYSAELEEQLGRRREMIQAIPAGLLNGEFFPVFQPKVDLATHAVSGFEALIRWRREATVISPGEFIPLAEETGHIVDLDLFVLREASRQLSQWNRLYKRKLTVSVNLSPLHFASDRIVGLVAKVLEEFDLDPSLLTLEITETVMLTNWQDVETILTALSELGVKISLDDFGTGYSSLAYLRQIPADELKIDRSFITEIERSDEARFIFDAIVDIATGLRMTIVVEGIETDAQAQIVTSFGCNLGQGFLWGRPEPPEGAEVLIRNGIEMPQPAIDVGRLA